MPRQPTPDERLARYRDKRDFTKTAEPSGTGPPPERGNRFVVQRHRATRLHYDLRLEAAGVLVSWAVPKGPTLDPKVRRLAVHVEDHPLDYFDFEGVIGEGEYGGGDVVVWDWGTWNLARGDDALAAIDKGDLHFDLHGEKLRGRFVLARRADERGKDNWLLIHKNDEDAVAGWDPEDHPRSVKSGRTNDEVKAHPDATWTRATHFVGPTADEIAALDAIGSRGRWEIQGSQLKLTNLDKAIVRGRDSEPPITKRDLIRYYAEIAPWMLPYLPFDSVPALVEAANRVPLDLGSRHGNWALIDIDLGPGSSFDDVLVVARLHRTALDHLGVDGGPTITGTGGVQIWVPVAPDHTAAAKSAWVEHLAHAVAATVPDLVRGDRAEHGDKTAIAPFRVRDAPGAPVCVPITWDELDDPDLAPQNWTIATVPARVARVGDPLAPLIGRAQTLPTL